MIQQTIMGQTTEHSKQGLLWEVINAISDEMVKKTNQKFEMWDYILENNTLELGTDEEIKSAYRLLQDPTIYAYAFFKDPRNSRKRFKLYAYQDAIINDPHKRIFFAAANQIGKSITLCVKGIHFALMNPGSTTLMISKTLPQSKDLLRQIKQFLQNSRLDFEFDIGESDTKTEIYLKHFKVEKSYDAELNEYFDVRVELAQSRIICAPASGGALGYPADLELIDELGFYDDGEYVYEQILQPRTYTTKGQIIVFTNPNGQQGICWKLWNDEMFHRYKFNFLDCPTNTQEEFDTLSKNLTREKVDSTMLAIFTSPEGGFLTLAERKDMQTERTSMLPSVVTQPIYIFFDWGKSRDRTVRIIGIPNNSNGKDWAPKVYVYEMKEYPQGTPYTEIIDTDLKNLINDVGPKNVAMVGWDNTGVGKGLEDFTKRVEQLGVVTMPVEFSLQNKSRIYTLWKLLVEQRRIDIPYISECDKQLSMLRFKTTARGLLQVHHENENDRDDFPDAIAGFCSLIIQPENMPITCEII